MTSYVSPGHVTGGTAAASTWADQVSDSMDYLAGADRCKVTTVDPVTNSFANATAKVVTWELETYDSNGLHAAAATKMVIVNPGLYVVRARLTFATNATGVRELWIARGPTGTVPGVSGANAEVLDNEPAVTGLETVITVADEIQCSAGDVVWVVGVQSSGGALAVDTTAYANAFSVRWVASS